MRKSKQTLQAEQNEVDRLLQKGIEDQEIMRTLGMPRNAFYLCKKRIYQQEAVIFKQQTVDDIAYKARVLHSRLTKLYDLVVTKLENSADITKGELNPSRDFANTAAIGQDLAVNIYKLESQGIQSLHGRHYGNLRRLEERQDSELLPLPITAITRDGE